MTCINPLIVDRHSIDNKVLVGGAMADLQIGEMLEFIEPVRVGDETIERGARVRVGFIMTEVVEPKVTLIFVDAAPPRTLQVDRHLVTMHCRRLAEQG